MDIKPNRINMVSWNVNGLRACVGKNFIEYFNSINADIFCIQETKLQENQIDLKLKGYYQMWNYAVKKGYSGTAVFTKMKPINVVYGIGFEELDAEGRCITAEYDKFTLINVYTPNSQRELTRLEKRIEWEHAFLEYVKVCEKTKPVIICGDLNVAHKEIDIENPEANRKNAGFTDDERQCFDNLLSEGYTDTFRYFYPERKRAYTWWSYMFKAREKNIGWRIDYFLTSCNLDNSLVKADIHSDIMGSDHCPVCLEISI